MKNLILITGFLAIVLNTLFGLILSSYTTQNFLLANLSLLLSTGILYVLAAKKITHGYQIGLSMLFSLTGTLRFFSVVFAPSTWEDNIWFIVALSILVFEVACVAVVCFFGKRR
jgi:hypothetical protein